MNSFYIWICMKIGCIIFNSIAHFHNGLNIWIHFIYEFVWKKVSTWIHLKKNSYHLWTHAKRTQYTHPIFLNISFSIICWNPRGSLLQEVPITKRRHFPLSGHLSYRYQLPTTWPGKKHHSPQPSSINTSTIGAHNSREHLLAVSLVEVSWQFSTNK